MIYWKSEYRYYSPLIYPRYFYLRLKKLLSLSYDLAVPLNLKQEQFHLLHHIKMLSENPTF